MGRAGQPKAEFKQTNEDCRFIWKGFYLYSQDRDAPGALDPDPKQAKETIAANPALFQALQRTYSTKKVQEGFKRFGKRWNEHISGQKPITSKFLALAGVPIAKKNEDRYQAPNLKPGSDHDSISSNDDDLSHLSDETKPQKKKKPFIDVDTVIRDFEDLLVANEDEEDEDSDMRAFIIPYPVPTTLKDANILYASITHFLVLVCHLPSGTEGENIVVNVDDKACSIAINVPVPTKLLDGKRLLGNRLEMANPGLGQLIEEELTREWEDAANGGIAAQGQVAFQKIVKWDSQFRVQGSWLYLDSHLPIPARSHDGSTPSVLSIRKVSTDQPQFAPNIDIDMSSFTGPAVLAIGMLPARDSEASTFVKPVHGLKSVAVFDDNDSPTSAHGGSGPTRSSPKRRRGTNRGRNRVEDDEEEEIEAPRPARGWLYRRT